MLVLSVVKCQCEENKLIWIFTALAVAGGMKEGEAVECTGEGGSERGERSLPSDTGQATFSGMVPTCFLP